MSQKINEEIGNKRSMSTGCDTKSFLHFILRPKLRSEMNRTKESPKILLMESSGNNFISLSVFYLIM
jgi:hypothetical protein